MRYVIKTGNDAPLLKIAFDLYALLGVAVPRTSFFNGTGALTIDIPEYYRDLYSQVGGGIADANERRKHRRDVFKEQKHLGSPIKGLFENLAIFIFLHDLKAIGLNYSNIALQNRGEDDLAVKWDIEDIRLIDEGYQQEFFSKLDPNLEGCLHPFLKNKEKEFHFDEVFQSATREQKLDGIKRIVALKDEDLERVIYNKKISDKFLPPETRKQIFECLKARREAFIQVYSNVLKQAEQPAAMVGAPLPKKTFVFSAQDPIFKEGPIKNFIEGKDYILGRWKTSILTDMKQAVFNDFLEYYSQHYVENRSKLVQNWACAYATRHKKNNPFGILNTQRRTTPILRFFNPKYTDSIELFREFLKGEPTPDMLQKVLDGKSTNPDDPYLITKPHLAY